jgi:hypothetical protein
MVKTRAELPFIGDQVVFLSHDQAVRSGQSLADEAKIAFGEIRSLNQLSEMEWAEYWGAVQEVSDRNGGSYRLPGRPWRFSREQLAPLGEPAFQGEHNCAVFAELGLGDEQIDGYIASGALVSVSIPTAVTDHSEEVCDDPELLQWAFLRDRMNPANQRN